MDLGGLAVDGMGMQVGGMGNEGMGCGSLGMEVGGMGNVGSSWGCDGLLEAGLVWLDLEGCYDCLELEVEVQDVPEEIDLCCLIGHIVLEVAGLLERIGCRRAGMGLVHTVEEVGQLVIV